MTDTRTDHPRGAGPDDSIAFKTARTTARHDAGAPRSMGRRASLDEAALLTHLAEALHQPDGAAMASAASAASVPTAAQSPARPNPLAGILEMPDTLASNQAAVASTADILAEAAACINRMSHGAPQLQPAPASTSVSGTDSPAGLPPPAGPALGGKAEGRKRADDPGAPGAPGAKVLGKKEGNRIAAQKCRRKKKLYIEGLQKRVGYLEATNLLLLEELKRVCQRVQSSDAAPAARATRLQGPDQKGVLAAAAASAIRNGADGVTVSSG